MDGGAAFEAVTRIGFAARGLVYGLIGYLALKSGRSEDASGIMDEMTGGGGRLLLAAMAAGFLAYAAWRLLDAWLDPERRGSGAKGLAQRVGAAGSGLVHLGFGVTAALHALGNRGGGGRDASEEGAATALGLPGGSALLVAAALLLAGIGLVQLGKAWTLSFMRRLGTSGAAHRWVCWLGRGGLAARGVIFLGMALLLWRAAQTHSSGAAGGLGDALQSMPAALQTAVAAGLILFGLFSLAEARYRRIEAPVG